MLDWFKRRPWWIRVTLVAGLIAGVAGDLWVADRLLGEEPAPYFESDEDHFLMGSVGTEALEGVPYWIWLVLPRVFPDLLPGPGGYAALGLLAKPGHDLPIGLSRVTVGVPRVAPNCALCHTASVRTAPDALPQVVAGAPAQQAGIGLYRQFLVDAAADPRFNAGTILGEIAKNYRLSLPDRLLYRFLIIPDTRRRLLELRSRDITGAEPDWGRGRSDSFMRLKVLRLGQAAEGRRGTADVVPLWNVARRDGQPFFWDGASASLHDAVLSSALTEGATRRWMDRDVEKWDATDPRGMSSLRRVLGYVSALKPPPFPFAIDQGLAAGGATVFARECAGCHAVDGARTGTVISAAEVGTDRTRAAVWTPGATAAYEAFAAGRAWKVPSFRVTAGYVSGTLGGAWLRAPYLHNGSVPSLSDLLEDPARRPAQFWRGYDVYDPAKVGFISSGADAERRGTRYDTRQPGNSNAGHAYGTALAPESTRALLEYLKTL